MCFLVVFIYLFSSFHESVCSTTAYVCVCSHACGHMQICVLVYACGIGSLPPSGFFEMGSLIYTRDLW